jgi:predicted Rossmann fold nucleotide-binding protein DprA/Smf involved in DNA uptake
MLDFAGSLTLLEGGARPLTSLGALLRSLGLDGLDECRPAPPVRHSPDALAALAATSTVPLHQDMIAAKAGLDASAVGVALLTLALENVVVEDPPGFFRRTTAK